MNRHLPSLAGTLAFLGLPFCLMSCDTKDPGLVEKLSLMEAELREKNSRLEELQQEMNRLSKVPANPETSAPDVGAAKSRYSGFVEELREKVAAELAGARIERTSVFPIQGPDPERPIVSKVAFSIVGAHGRAAELTIPVYADASGKWQQPGFEDLAAFKAGLNDKPQTAAKANTPATPAPKPRSKPTDVMGADRTVEIQWNDGTPAAPGGPSQPPPQPQPAAPQPAAPALPKKVMPTSRDVIIDFE